VRIFGFSRLVAADDLVGRFEREESALTSLQLRADEDLAWG